MLIGGVEMSLGALLTVYVLGIFPDRPSQLDGALVTSAFWAGILLMRILCVFRFILIRFSLSVHLFKELTKRHR